MDNQKNSPSKKLFSVPIYFRSKEEHRKYFEEKWQKYLEDHARIQKQLYGEITDKDKLHWNKEFKHTYFHFWKYAEIIGYVEFRKKENALYAFVIMAETDKFAPIINKKTFRIADEFSPFKIRLEGILNDQIIKYIYATLEKVNNCNPRYQKYYIDKSEIDNFVHLIDFHKI